MKKLKIEIHLRMYVFHFSAFYSLPKLNDYYVVNYYDYEYI